jgi:hypothetical protein
VNGDSGSTHERGPSLVDRWAYRAGTRDLAALVGQVQNIFFPTIHNLNFSVPIVQQDRPAVRQGYQFLYGVRHAWVISSNG